MNVYFIKGIPFGSYPPIRLDKMWLYHSHTHAALLGWITFSFIGMIYIVIPAIFRSNSLQFLQGSGELSEMLQKKTMKKAFRQLTIMLLSATAILLAFFLENQILLGLSGLLFGCSVFFVIINLRSELYEEE